MKQALRELGLEHALQLKEAEQQALLKAARKRFGEGRPLKAQALRSLAFARGLWLYSSKSPSLWSTGLSGFADLDEFFTAQSKRLGMTRREVKNLCNGKRF